MNYDETLCSNFKNKHNYSSTFLLCKCLLERPSSTISPSNYTLFTKQACTALTDFVTNVRIHTPLYRNATVTEIMMIYSAIRSIYSPIYGQSTACPTHSELVRCLCQKSDINVDQKHGILMLLCLFTCVSGHQ